MKKQPEMRSGRFYTLLVMRRGRQSKTPEVSRGKEKGWIVLENPYTHLCSLLLPGIIGKLSLLGLSVLSLKRPYCEDVGIRSRHKALVAK